MPVIAAIEGPCLGGGLGLALACDLRIATTTAFFAIPAAARLGLAYPPEALVGPAGNRLALQRKKRILFTAETDLPRKARCEIGLINETVDPPNLEERINALCAARSSQTRRLSI